MQKNLRVQVLTELNVKIINSELYWSFFPVEVKERLAL